MSDTNPSIVVTGTSWMGSGIGSIESTCDRLFREAEDEIVMTVYTIGSGADLIFNWLKAALNRGVQIRLVINNLYEQPSDVVARLIELSSLFTHFQLYNFLGKDNYALHAKAIVVDHRIALIGSSNMSRRGLLANHELAVLAHGTVASVAGQAIDHLINCPHVRLIKAE